MIQRIDHNFISAECNMLKDKINEMINEQYIRDNPVVFMPSKDNLKPGVRLTKNGKYYLEGKGFIRSTEAYL